MPLAPFSSVVAQHGPMVWRVCRSILEPADADDAWSDTFLAALRAYPQLDSDANVAAWLTTIAHRKALDLTRRRARSAVPVGAVDPGGAVVPGPEPSDDELAVAMGRLSERQRTVVLHHHVAGIPYDEIARTLEITPEAARRSASDGIAKLRTLYRKGR